MSNEIDFGRSRFSESMWDIVDDIRPLAYAVGAIFLAWCYVQSQQTRIKNEIQRARENGNIAPLNPQIEKEIGHIVSSKF